MHELVCIQIGDVDDGLDQIIKQLMFQEEDGCSLYEDLSDISTNWNASNSILPTSIAVIYTNWWVYIRHV